MYRYTALLVGDGVRVGLLPCTLCCLGLSGGIGLDWWEGNVVMELGSACNWSGLGKDILQRLVVD